jgi:hypothetical protein
MWWEERAYRALGKRFSGSNKTQRHKEKSAFRNYGFEKLEQFVFKKDVPLSGIDALVEIKKPILQFEANPEGRNLIHNEILE